MPDVFKIPTQVMESGSFGINESFEKMVVNQWPLEEKLPSTWGENAEEDNIQKIKQVKQYIQQNLDRELHREEIAEQVFLNASYLSRLFSKYTGMSLKEYITFEKMKLAHNIDYNDKSFDINYCAKGWVYEFFLIFLSCISNSTV
mgnify:CR=1 FL=1